MVFGDPDRLRQVFLNILLNAIDAVNGDPSGPARIEITTACVFESPGRPAGAPTPFIQVTIQDSGSGISPSLLATIFDPFLTTKEPGQGTGLGLSVAFMIVEKSGGHIRAFNRRDPDGAVFQVALPLSKPAAAGLNDRVTGDNGR